MIRIEHIMILMVTAMVPTILVDFNKETELRHWTIVNDVVMGGRSRAGIQINEEGHAVFSGRVSLDNNGGFASVRHEVLNVNVKGQTHVMLKLKGDGKRYQFRIRKSEDDYFSYITYFETTGDWQEVKIPLGEMYASFRGRKLPVPNYEPGKISEIALLIGNKKQESFILLLDKVWVE